MENLRIDNPCPMLLNRMEQNGNCFACKSCNKEVIDFRGKTRKEIASKINTDTCGIFTNDQLPGQQRMSFFRQMAFYGLTVLSFLGFSVSPLHAAPKQFSANTEISSFSNKRDDEKKKQKKMKKQMKQMRKAEKRNKNRVTMGCPSF